MAPSSFASFDIAEAVHSSSRVHPRVSRPDVSAVLRFWKVKPSKRTANMHGAKDQKTGARSAIKAALRGGEPRVEVGTLPTWVR